MRPPVDTLLPALGRLDALMRAVAAGEPAAPTISTPGPGEPESRLDVLGHAFGLDTFDLDVLLLALAPDLDSGYGPVFAALQGGDPAVTRPSADLLLALLCRSPGERLGRRARFGVRGRLRAHALIRLGPEVVIDERIVDHLLGDDALDSRLTPCCRVHLADPVVADRADPAHGAALARLGPGGVLALEGPRAAGAIAAAHALAAARDQALLVLDAGATADAQTARLAARDAVLGDALLCVDLRSASDPAPVVAIAGHPGPLVVATTDARTLDGLGELLVAPITVPPPDLREQLWARALGNVPASADVPALASRFRLGEEAIAGAVRAARGRAAMRAAATGRRAGLRAEDLFEAARARSSGGLDALATKAEPIFGWDDIVLPEDARAQLHEICARVAQRDRVIDGWGFRNSIGAGLGVSALFAGASGTGKTMAAGVLARALKLDLYVIDLSTIVSKYIGETAKNLSALFDAAEDASAILFFDEADALFGKRSEVRDSHDRYANVEVAHLLQRMEAYDGVAILATNLRQSLDEAFARRLAFTVHFPFPGAAERLEIWRGVWPAGVPRARDLDLPDLAERFRLAGGTIRNAALGAAFLAASDGGVVRREHLLHAIRREYQKLGKGLSDGELHGAAFEEVLA